MTYRNPRFRIQRTATVINTIRTAITEMLTSIAGEDAITLSSVLDVSAMERRNMGFHFLRAFT